MSAPIVLIYIYNLISSHNLDYVAILSLVVLKILYLKKKYYRKDAAVNTVEVNNINKHLNCLPSNKKKKKIGLLTNEIPPIIYGGVSTWILNFIDMFDKNEKYEVIVIYLAYQDYPPEIFKKLYPNIRYIFNQNDIDYNFKDIDICINNVWITYDIVINIKNTFQHLPIISVCHSLIQMEHITNLGSQYTKNWENQDLIFKYSDYVILISNSEKNHYFRLGYNKFKAIPIVIYNSYKPKYDNRCDLVDYSNNNIGYIGRHVPRKRPELPILSTLVMNRPDIEVYNMGVDYTKNKNLFWDKMDKEYDNLHIIPFSSFPADKIKFWSSIGVNCITGIYEPFGYTVCETLDRGVPCIVQNIEGPAEIIGDYKEYVITYEVEKNFEKDLQNFTLAVEKFLKKPASEKKLMALKARKALDNFRPNVIIKDWLKLLDSL